MLLSELAFLPILAYFFASVAIAGSVGFTAGSRIGVYAIITSVLSLIAGGGLKASLWWGERRQKIAGPVIALLIMAVAQ